jgi:hypothetical protein
MSDFFSFISFVVFIFLFVIVLLRLIKLKSQSIKLKLQIIDLVQQNELLKKTLESKENPQIEKTEGFLNFVTQSRDWAFEYIEDVQKVINKVIDDTSSTIEYHNKFGSMDIEPYATQITTLANAIEELKFLLPNEEFFK